MSSEQNAAEQKRAARRVEDKTDAPRGVRSDEIKNLPPRNITRVKHTASLGEVVQLMKAKETDAVLVYEGERLAGIFTERDFLVKVSGEAVDGGEPVARFMSAVGCTLAPGATLGDAVRAMNEAGCRTIPILEDGSVVGAVSVLDVMTYLAESYPKETMNLPPVPAQVMDTPEGG